jgi:hypothetical protein
MSGQGLLPDVESRIAPGGTPTREKICTSIPRAKKRCRACKRLASAHKTVCLERWKYHSNFRVSGQIGPAGAGYDQNVSSHCSNPEVPNVMRTSVVRSRPKTIPTGTAGRPVAARKVG